MKLHLLPKLLPFVKQNHQYSTGALAFLFSAKTNIPITPSSTSSASLFQRIQAIRDPKSSLVPVLEQWVGEGRPVGKRQLQYIALTMKDFKRYHHALQISQWMSDRCYFALSPADVAARLDLIHRVRGIELAENYFKNVADCLKTRNVYGALLRIYVRERSVEKAEAIMQKMRELDFLTSSFPYNMLIYLYTQTADFDKIKILIQEMDQNGLPRDKYTIQHQLAVYVATSDISGVETVLNLAENDFPSFVHWSIYSTAANGYLKVGLIDKALAMLKKCEAIMPYQKSNSAFQCLLSLYGRTGKRDELYRVWNAYKSSDKEINKPYACMITSLVKLDDLEGAEMVFQEWESRYKIHDFRVLNVLLVAYCRKGFSEKAEYALKKAAEGRTPYASSWGILARGYTEQNEMPKAVEMLKRAISVQRDGWWPESVTLDACLGYLESQGDVSAMKETIHLLKKLGPLNRDIYHRWLRTCIATAGSVSHILDQMKMDGFFADEETENILATRPSLLSV